MRMASLLVVLVVLRSNARGARSHAEGGLLRRHRWSTPERIRIRPYRKSGRAGQMGRAGRRENRYLAQVDADSTRVAIPRSCRWEVSAADVDLSVRFKPVSGRVDQAAGLVWRFQDENNYYIVRANALEDNVVLYKVENGTRTDLPLKGEGRTYGKKSEVPSGQWSTLRVVANGRLFEVYLNGAKLYEVEDGTFSKPGRSVSGRRRTPSRSSTT